MGNLRDAYLARRPIEPSTEWSPLERLDLIEILANRFLDAGMPLEWSYFSRIRLLAGDFPAEWLEREREMMVADLQPTVGLASREESK